MSSKRRSTTSGMSTDATAAVMRSRPGEWWRRRIATTVSMPRNESMMPEAARSCQKPLTLTGIKPTADKCRPAETISTLNDRDRLTPRSSCRRRRSAPRRQASTTIIRPAASMVRLNAWPEKSSRVPSSLKAVRHQPCTVVVDIDSAVPAASTAMATRASAGPVCNRRRSGRGRRRARGREDCGRSASVVIGYHGSRGALRHPGPPAPQPPVPHGAGCRSCQPPARRSPVESIVFRFRCEAGVGCSRSGIRHAGCGVSSQRAPVLSEGRFRTPSRMRRMGL